MNRHRFHGDPLRFEVIADHIYEKFYRDVRYIADVAGGQGMLSRLLSKKYHYACEVVDPRGWVLKGVKNEAKKFDASQAMYYDLIVGLHPDEATRAIAEAAKFRPVLLIPCCNFWSEEKLGREELLQAIEHFYSEHAISFERHTFPFKGPKNIGLISTPPS
jgi:hypothetical protein